MASVFDTEEYWCLSKLSHGFNALWRRALVMGDGPQTMLVGQILELAANELRIRHGLPSREAAGHVFDHEPRNMREALRWLQRPEAYGDGKVVLKQKEVRYRRWSPNYMLMRGHAEITCARYKYMHPLAREFLRVMLKHCDAVSVPIFALSVYQDRHAHGAAYVRGETDREPRFNAYCYGKAIVFGHYAEREFRGWCLKWLNATAEIAAHEAGCTIGYSEGAPGEFVIGDKDGVLCEYDGVFPSDRLAEERRRMEDYYLDPESIWRPPPDGSALDPALWSGGASDDDEEG